MQSLKGKNVLITGASSGIGAACAETFGEAGANLILIARRLSKLQSLAETLKAPSIQLIDLDIRDKTEVEDKLSIVADGIDILINNAGLSRGLDKFQEASIDDWEEMIDTNLKGLLYVSRPIIASMFERNFGHIINLGSIAGHQTYTGGSVYCATKAAVRALTEGMKMDVLGSNVRITSIDPGMVETEFSEVRFRGDKERSKKVYVGLQPLVAQDIADAIFFAATRPPHVNISEMLILPTAQASATLVHRKQ